MKSKKTSRKKKQGHKYNTDDRVGIEMYKDTRKLPAFRAFMQPFRDPTIRIFLFAVIGLAVAGAYYASSALEQDAQHRQQDREFYLNNLPNEANITVITNPQGNIALVVPNATALLYSHLGFNATGGITHIDKDKKVVNLN